MDSASSRSAPYVPFGTMTDAKNATKRSIRKSGGQEAAGPAGPERPQLDGQGLAPLTHQERGDEEAGEDEERVDPHEPAVHVRDPPVEHHHGEDGAGSDPVERGEIGQTSVRDRALVVLHRAHPSSVA